MRVLQVILGVLVAMGGFYCCTYPVATEVSLSGILAIVMGISMVVCGIGEILNWNDARKRGASSGWTLLGAIASLVLGLALLCCNFVASGIIVATFLSYFLCIWLIIGGVCRIGAARNLRKFGKAVKECTPNSRREKVAQEKASEVSKNWILVLVSGILMLLAGLCCLGSPIILVGFMGMCFGISMVVGGVSLVCLALASPAK